MGRDVELAQVDAAFSDAAAGRPRLLVVLGEAGIGKTGVAEAAIARASAAGGRVLVGACLDLAESGLPFLPVAEALRRLARTTPPDALDELLGPARDDLAAIAPELAHATAPELAGPGVPAGPGRQARTGGPSGVGQARLFEAFIGLLSRLGSQRPALVVLEDVQWIDRATRDLVTFLVRNLTTERIVAVITCRVDDLPPGHRVLAWLAELGRAPGAQRLELERLDLASVGTMLERLTGAPVASELADRLWRRSDGNPLFVEELLAAERDGGSDRAWRPASLVEILVARVAALATPTRPVVDAISVAGRPVGDAFLAALLDADDGAVAAALRDAIACGVLVSDREARGYRFRHELLREAVERDLLPGERRSLHERFARLLAARPELVERTRADATAELAHHWAAAGLVAEAFVASIAAADAAEAVQAFGASHQHLERAIELEGRLAPDAVLDHPDPVALRRRAADMADLDGAFGRAIELVREALDRVDLVHDPTTAGVLHGRLGFLTWVVGDSAAAIAEHQAAVDLVPAEPPTAERAHVLGGLGGALMGAGRWSDSRTICEAAIACAARIGAGGEESRARNMLGSDLVALGEIEAGLAQLRRAREIAEQGERPELLIVAHHNLALNLAAADFLDEALAEAEAGQAAARAAGLDRRFGQELVALQADVLLRLGRWAEADRLTSDALGRAQARLVTTYLATVRARLLALRGEASAAATHLDAIDDTALDPDVAAFVSRVRAEAALADHRPADALEAISVGLASLEGLDDVLWAAPLVALGLRAAAELAEAARAARDAAAVERAHRAAEPLRGRAAWLDARAATSSARAWAALAQAETARLDDRPDPDAWRAAAILWDAVPDPSASAYATLRAVEASLRASGIRAAVADELRAAHDTARVLGALPLLREIEALAGRARITFDVAIPVPESPAVAPAQRSTRGADAGQKLGLSAREIEVLELVAHGLTNGEIAARLFITRKTAGVHVTHILAKLGLSNRVEAAMVAARLGLGVSSEGSD